MSAASPDAARGLAASVAALASGYLSRQRWFAGRAQGGDDQEALAVELLDAEILVDGNPTLLWLLVETGRDASEQGGSERADYQLMVGLRPDHEPMDFLSGHADSVLGRIERDGAGWTAYDALLDGALNIELLRVVTENRVRPERARLIAAEQSNTSIVYDERYIAKVFRRIRAGANPDVEVTFGLDGVGFNHVATPIAVWHRAGYDLVFVQQFLAGGTDGWALALTSLRDLYGACSDAEEAPALPEDLGGDFAAEAHRLGHVTGRLHVALAASFDTHPADTASWSASMAPGVEQLGDEGFDVRAARGVLQGLEGVKDPGAAIRVHGDYHLGQVMRTDAGWFVLDFEGEPARPVAERTAPKSPLKDVAGMLRSFQYAAAVALSERAEPDRRPALYEVGGAWETRNRDAFVDGYRSTPGIGDLVPSDDESFNSVLAAFELEKAVYELGYERAYRPDWVMIPLAALRRLLDTAEPS